VTFQERKTAAFLAVFFVALFLTAFVHQSATFAGSLPGHLLGTGGTILIFMALAYPFRKRILGKRGRENPLTRHILYGLLGFFLFRKVSRAVKDQRGDLDLLKKHFEDRKQDVNACAIPLGVDSDTRTESFETPRNDGMELERRCGEVLDLAYSVVEIEYTLSIFSKLRALFSLWTRVHYLLSLCLFSFLIVHVLNVFYYAIRWL